MSPLDFEGKNKISFEEVYNSEAIDAGLTCVLFQHDARGVAPAWDRDAMGNGNVHEPHKALEQGRVLDEQLVVA